MSGLHVEVAHPGVASRLTPGRVGREVWGIIGGLGPLASAEFIRTIYDHADLSTEQDAPRVIMFSDPTFPDRTTTITNGLADSLLQRLEDGMWGLIRAGATDIAVCCLTIHSLFPRLPRELRDKAVSLVDLVLDSVRGSQFARHLLLCTNGSRQANLFEGRENWPPHRVALPDHGDQQQIHELIYRLKNKAEPRQFCDLVENLLAKYEADAFVAGCTELHLVCREWKKSGRRLCMVDPLEILASRIAGRRSIAHPYV